MAERRRAGPESPSSGDAASTRPAVAVWIAAATLVVAGIAAYLPALEYPFVNWDDPAYVAANPYIQSLAPGAVARLFAPSTIVVANYAPVTLLSLAIDHARGGLDAGVYHQTSVALHVLSALLVLLLLRRLFGSVALAWVGAIVYLLHPVQVESVAWIAERKNVLSQTLALGAMLLELGAGAKDRAASDSLTVARLRRPLALLLFALALLAKATVVVAPLLLVACWRLASNESWRKIARRVSPYLGLALVMGIVTIAVQRGAGGVKPYYGDSALLTLATMTRVVWLELGLFVDFGALSAIHRPPVAASPLEPSVLAAAAALIAVGAGAWRVRRRWPLVALGVVWYAIGLLPVLNVLPLPHLMAERFLYLSSIGVATLAAAVIGGVATLAAGATFKPAASPRVGTALVLVLGALVGTVCLAGTRARLPVWSDSERLWRETLATTPSAEVAHSNLGLLLAARGETDAALEHYRQAVALRPDYTEARINLANALTRRGEQEAALEEYRRALALDPGNAEAYYNLGVTLEQTGAVAAARNAYAAAVKAAPDHGRALNNLALIVARDGRLDEALALLDRAVSVAPENAEAHLNRGIVLGRSRRGDEALASLRQAIALRPGYARAHLQLGLGLAASGNLAEGRRAVARALELDPGLATTLPPQIRELLGMP